MWDYLGFSFLQTFLCFDVKVGGVLLCKLRRPPPTPPKQNSQTLHCAGRCTESSAADGESTSSLNAKCLAYTPKLVSPGKLKP